MTTSQNQSAEHVGVLVVRVTMEPSGPLLRITRTLDVSAPVSEVSATTDVEAACGILRRWLRDFQSRGSAGTGRP